MELPGRFSIKPFKGVDSVTPSVTSQQFQAVFCQHFNCPLSGYEQRAFRELLYSHARLVAPVLATLRPDFFAEDFRFIRYLGEATDLREAKASAAEFQDSNAARRGFLRTRLRIRVSGWKATQLAHRLFTDAIQCHGS
jgi:hypothetical protein